MTKEEKFYHELGPLRPLRTNDVVGRFLWLKNTLVYVGSVKGSMAYVSKADYPSWHKKVPIAKLRERYW